MRVYEVRYSGGHYEDAFDYSYGIYDSLERAVEEADKRMTELEENSDIWQEDIDEFTINEWELNENAPNECDVRCWFRAKGGKYGKFVLSEDYITDKYQPYQPREENNDWTEEEQELMDKWFERKE